MKNFSNIEHKIRLFGSGVGSMAS